MLGESAAEAMNKTPSGESLRLLLVNPTSRRVAGTETYIEDLLAELEARSIPVAFLAGSDEPQDRAAIAHGSSTPLFHSMPEAQEWQPTVFMANGRIPESWETELCELYPGIYFIHNFYGTCISGLKRHQKPHVEACDRTLGPVCLALYLPRSCGGMNPLTMITLYGKEKAQQRRLHGYRQLVTHSERMREEYLRHGFAPEDVKVIPFACIRETQLRPPIERDWYEGPARLLFAGRMEGIKGGAECIEAAALWSATHDRPVDLTMAGEGERRVAWTRQAEELRLKYPRFQAHFPGWMSGTRLEEAFASHHLFVMPSLWPEPFGKGGIEAGCSGCPSVGYRIGGIPQWLHEGENGHLADWRDQPARNLALAIGKALDQPDHYLQLRAGARRMAALFTSKVHCDHLLPLLVEVGAR